MNRARTLANSGKGTTASARRHGKGVTDWSVWDARLGTLPDNKLAKLAGCSEDTLINRRRRLGIQPFTQRDIDWAKWDAELGRATDQDIAQKIGCTVKTVERRRGKLGIASYRDSGRRGRIPDKIQWAKWDEELGRAPEWEVAKRIGCSVSPVEKRRKKLRIPAFSQHSQIDWQAWDGELGKAPDWDLAGRIGCSTIAVEKRREKLGIRPFSKNDRIDWKTWDKVLGSVPDQEAAEMAGCSITSIRRRRKRLGIEDFKRDWKGKITPARPSAEQLDNAAVTI
jgi:hypothetical protein